MPHACTKDQLVEQPAIGLFTKRGWSVAAPPPREIAAEIAEVGKVLHQHNATATPVLHEHGAVGMPWVLN